MEQPNALDRGATAVWNVINTTRKIVLNLIFVVAVLIVIAIIGSSQSTVIVQPQTALVINPDGFVVEQYSSDPLERAIDQMVGSETPETRFRDMLRAILIAKNDDRISSLVIDPDGLLGMGPAQLSEFRRTIDSFRESQKPVLAYSEAMEQTQYALASTADEVWLHPEGLVLLQGYGVYRNYYKDALDFLDVQVNLFRVGEYKSAAEPYIRNDMSEASRESNRYWLAGLWDTMLNNLSGSRPVDTDGLRNFVENYAQLLREVDGDTATMARNAGLVDQIGTRSDFNQHMLSYAADDGDGFFRQVGFKGYLGADRLPSPLTDRVAVIVASGPITFGDQPPGIVGGESTVRQIYAARTNETVKAIVLRVDSPGGAVLPSEKIRQELNAARNDGIPVFVSMGTVAASGGYWISMSADRIFAEANTITGSIGIYGLLLNFPQTLEKIGVHTDGVGTTPLAGAFRPDMPMSDQVAAIIQSIIDEGYTSFISKVAESRGMSVEEVNEIARGRVWTGQQALDRGLVDELGGLVDAIAAVASVAGLGEGYAVEYFEEKPTAFEQWLLSSSVSIPTPDLGWFKVAQKATRVPEELRLVLENPQRPVGIYAHCHCDVR